MPGFEPGTSLVASRHAYHDDLIQHNVLYFVEYIWDPNTVHAKSRNSQIPDILVFWIFLSSFKLPFKNQTPLLGFWTLLVTIYLKTIVPISDDTKKFGLSETRCTFNICIEYLAPLCGRKCLYKKCVTIK